MQRRLTGYLATGAVMAAGFAGTTAAPAHAQAYGSLSNQEKFYCAISYADCRTAQDAAGWALRVTVWKFGTQGHNDMGDAFRHCAWNGAMAQRMGRARAKRIADNHEKAEGQPGDEKRMDLNNNIVGRNIGIDSRTRGGADTWGYVLATCERTARAKQLYGLRGRGAY